MMSTTGKREVEECLRIWSGRVLLAPGNPPPSPVSDPRVMDAFLQRHGIALCINHALSDHSRNQMPSVPAADTHRAIAVEMARTHELSRVAGVLQTRLTTPPLVYKGQALAHSLYPQPWLRPRGDIDILVQRSDLSQAVNEMERLGYQKVLSTDGDLIMTQISMYRQFSGFEHIWDIHWDLSNRPTYSDILGYGELMRRAVEIRVNEVAFLAPCPSDSLLIACLHLIGHHGGDVRMIWLHDIQLLAAALSDSEHRRFLDKAMDNARVRAACHAAMALTQRYLPTGRVDDLGRELDPGAGARLAASGTYLAHLAEDALAIDKGIACDSCGSMFFRLRIT